MNNWNKYFFLFWATGGGSGYIPWAPGTAGTAVGILFFWGLSQLSGALYFLTLFAFIFFAVWIAARAEIILKQPDARVIVIDEIAGLLVAMVGIPFCLKNIGMSFLIFRILDTIKPFPARWIDQNLSGGWGIVFDDLIAGIYTNIIFRIITPWI